MKVLKYEFPGGSVTQRELDVLRLVYYQKGVPLETACSIYPEDNGVACRLERRGIVEDDDDDDDDFPGCVRVRLTALGRAIVVLHEPRPGDVFVFGRSAKRWAFRTAEDCWWVLERVGAPPDRWEGERWSRCKVGLRRVERRPCL